MRVPIEIEGLEKYMKGFNENSLNLLVGSANSSKTLLGLQYLAGGSKRGENVLYISLVQPALEIKQDLGEQEIYIDDIFVFDAVPSSKKKEIQPYREVTFFTGAERFGEITELKKTMEVDILALRETLKNIFDRSHYDRIVIDSLSALRIFYMRGLDSELGMHAFIQFILGTTSAAVLFIVDNFLDVKYIEKYMDTVLRLIEPEPSKRAELEVLKYDDFIDTIRFPLDITSRGFVLNEESLKKRR
jgi:archaellum biogenesis ATPase FlaH